MTTIDFNNTAIDSIDEAPRSSWLARWFAAWKRRRSQRLTLAALSRMDEHLLRDMGIEPMDVEDALLSHNSSALFSQIRRNDGN